MTLLVEELAAFEPATSTRQAQFETIDLFGISVHDVTLEETITELVEWMEEPAPFSACRYVVTPNVDHIVKLQTNPALQAAGTAAALQRLS